MEGFVKGDVIVLEFPFSDLKISKRRPSLIIKVPKGEDVIICQITAESQRKDVEVPISKNEFIIGELRKNSYVRIDKLTTIRKTKIKYKIGSLKQDKFNEILNKVCDFLKS